MNAKMDTSDACDLRFGQVGIACVRVRHPDAAALCEELERRVRSAPQLFSRAAVVLDLSHLLDVPDDGTVDALLEAVRSAGMLPVGLAYGTSATEALAQRMGLPLIAKFRAAYEPADGSIAAAPALTASTPPAPAREPVREPVLSQPDMAVGAQRHDGTVRSGQQVYARDRDLVVVGTIANGAEIIADGRRAGRHESAYFHRGFPCGTGRHCRPLPRVRTDSERPGRPIRAMLARRRKAADCTIEMKNAPMGSERSRHY